MPDVSVLTAAPFLAHWQGHRHLTRRVIEAFPDDDAFTTFSVGGMRPFAAMVAELLQIAAPILRGVATGDWSGETVEPPPTRAEALRQWDHATAEIDRLWPEVPAHRFEEVDTAFGQWEGPGYWQLLYAVDNEVHHRAQAYVYLRVLGAEPPPFWERGEPAS
ncbi:DinB family protein [Rubrivirga sp.]|uniref:DinB family protein n=1 Tax=Rubrivirga sp. TaxID=1885344 RepID=UPI003B520F70